jgi:hypothetical protein
MAKVNPPPQIRRPQKITGDRELRPYFERLEWLLFQLWTRTGGGDDSVDDTVNNQVDTDGLFGLFGRIAALELRNLITTAVDYTTIGSDIVICTDAVTVTLNDEPDDQEISSIKRTAGQVILDGGGRLIDGNSTLRINVKYTSLDVIYTVETDSWHVI